MLSKQERLVIAIGAVFTLASTMVSTFANVYLLEFTGSLLVMTLYAIFRYGSIAISAYVAARLSTRIRFSYIMSMGLLFITSAVLTLLGVKSLIESERWLVFIVGSIWGMGEGFFWISLNTIIQSSTSLESRMRFISINGVLANFTTIVAPFLSAFILSMFSVELSGYYFMFVLAIVLFVVTAVLSFSLVGDSRSSFSLRHMFDGRDRDWSRILLAQYMWGVREAATVSLVGLVIYDILGNSSVYGNFLGFFAIMATLMHYFSGKLIHDKNALGVITIASIGVLVSGWSLLLMPSLLGVLIYGVLYNLSLPLASNGFSGMCMGVIYKYREKENLLGRSLARELMIGAGRISGLVLVVVISLILGLDIGIKIAMGILFLFSFVFALVLNLK